MKQFLEEPAKLEELTTRWKNYFTLKLLLEKY